jgi:hypothetical protein
MPASAIGPGPPPAFRRPHARRHLVHPHGRFLHLNICREIGSGQQEPDRHPWATAYTKNDSAFLALRGRSAGAASYRGNAERNRPVRRNW